MGKRLYRLGYYKEIPGRGYRGFDHFSRATYATLDAATQAASASLAGRRTWAPDRNGFVYASVVVFYDGTAVTEVMP